MYNMCKMKRVDTCGTIVPCSPLEEGFQGQVSIDRRWSASKIVGHHYNCIQEMEKLLDLQSYHLQKAMDVHVQMAHKIESVKAFMSPTLPLGIVPKLPPIHEKKSNNDNSVSRCRLFRLFVK